MTRLLSLVCLVAVAAATGACDQGYPDSSNPQVWRQFWYAKHAHNLNAVELPNDPGPRNGEVVLLIPGSTIGTEFFDPMRARLENDGYTTFVWAPPDLFTQSLALGAERIAAKVNELRAATGLDRIHIVAECDGGVATRYYLQVLGGYQYVDKVVTFVSAHHGTDPASLAAWFTGWQAMRDITPGSAFMRTLAAAPFPADLDLTSIYSCWDELLYPYTTARVAGATNVEFCERYVSHFDGFWDEVVYGRIVAALRGEPAPLYY